MGVEGTGSYGKGVARLLREQGVRVVEVNRPDRKTRRRKGKSDPIDAIAAARAVLSGDAEVIPKTGDGAVEGIRALRVARNGAVKARTATINELKALVTTAPARLRQALRGKPVKTLLAACAALQPDLDHLADPIQATMLALRTLAQRHATLDQQVHDLNTLLQPLVTATARPGPLSRDLQPQTHAFEGVQAHRSPPPSDDRGRRPPIPVRVDPSAVFASDVHAPHQRGAEHFATLFRYPRPTRVHGVKQPLDPKGLRKANVLDTGRDVRRGRRR